MASVRFERACEEYSILRRPFYAHKLLRFYDDTPPHAPPSTHLHQSTDTSLPPYPTFEDERATLRSHFRQDGDTMRPVVVDKRWSHLPAAYSDIITKYFSLGEVSAMADCAKLLSYIFEKYDLVPKLFTTPFESAVAAAPASGGINPSVVVGGDHPADVAYPVSSPLHPRSHSSNMDGGQRAAQTVFASVRKMRDVVAGRRSQIRGHQEYKLGEQHLTANESFTPSRGVSPIPKGPSRAATPHQARTDTSHRSIPSTSSGGRLNVNPTAVVDLAEVGSEDLVLERSSHHIKAPLEPSQRGTLTSSSNNSTRRAADGLTSDQMRRFHRLVKGGHLVAAGAVIRGTSAGGGGDVSTTTTTTSVGDVMTTYLDTRARTPWKSADQGADTRRPISSHPNPNRKFSWAGEGIASSSTIGARPLSPLKLSDTGDLQATPLSNLKVRRKGPPTNSRPTTDFATFARQSQSSAAV